MAATADLKIMDPEELELRLAESRSELLNLRFQVATGQLDNSARLGQVRRDIARILTIMREREIEEAEGLFVPLATLGAKAGRRGKAAEAAAADETVDEEPEDGPAEQDEETEGTDG
jgi:large subunit ribosomal protein L29